MEPTGYVFQAALLCPLCAHAFSFPYYDSDMGKTVHSTDDMNAEFSTDETDSIQCCDFCFEIIETTVIS